MNEKHTPGPWKSVKSTNGSWSIDAQDESAWIARTVPMLDLKTGIALFDTEKDALLIAAAPDLLEFAKLIVNGDGHSLREIMQQGKAAIAKATGETK